MARAVRKLRRCCTSGRCSVIHSGRLLDRETAASSVRAGGGIIVQGDAIERPKRHRPPRATLCGPGPRAGPPSRDGHDLRALGGASASGLGRLSLCDRRRSIRLSRRVLHPQGRERVGDRASGRDHRDQRLVFDRCQLPQQIYRRAGDDEGRRWDGRAEIHLCPPRRSGLWPVCRCQCRGYGRLLEPDGEGLLRHCRRADRGAGQGLRAGRRAADRADHP